MSGVADESELVGDAELDLAQVECVEDLFRVVGEVKPMLYPRGRPIEHGRDLLWCVVGLLDEARDGPRFLDWGEISTDKIFSEPERGRRCFVCRRDERRDGLAADQAEGLEAAVTNLQVEAVAVLGDADWIDQAYRSDAVREVAKLLGVECEAVVLLVVGVNQVKGELAKRR